MWTLCWFIPRHQYASVWNAYCDSLLHRVALVDRTQDVMLIVCSYNKHAGDWDCVAAVGRLSALHYSVDFIFLSFRIMGFIVEL